MLDSEGDVSRKASSDDVYIINDVQYENRAGNERYTTLSSGGADDGNVRVFRYDVIDSSMDYGAGKFVSNVYRPGETHGESTLMRT